jgi:hypothetical protein
VPASKLTAEAARYTSQVRYVSSPTSVTHVSLFRHLDDSKTRRFRRTGHVRQMGQFHRRERPSSAKTRFAECSMSQSRRRPRAAAQTTALFIIIGVYSSAPKTDVLRDINGLPNVRPHGSVNTAPSGRIHSCTWHISVEAGGCKGRTTRYARPDWGTLGDSPKLPAPSSRVPSCLILKNKRPRLPTL